MPVLLIMTEWCKCFKILKIIITLEPKIADKIAATGPHNDDVDDVELWLNREFGCMMNTIPTIESAMLKQLKSEHGSLRNIFENMATKTGVE